MKRIDTGTEMIKNLQPFHFFASCAMEWRVNEDLSQLMNDMKKNKLPFALFYLPCNISTEYKIEDFAPVVEGKRYLGYYKA